MTAEGWEASALTAEKIAAGWLKMANERKVHDETKEYYFRECRRLMDMADFYRKHVTWSQNNG